MAVLRQITRKVPVVRATTRSIKRGVGAVPTGRSVKHRKLDPLKSRHVARPAQGNNSLTST